MKLKLSSIKDIQILTVSESVSLDNFKVLKAGITKLFKSGKNRLILDFVHAEDLQNDILREISVLNIYARELAGEIILSGISTEVKNKIDHFAQPPLITCFLNTGMGIQYFEKRDAALDSSTKSNAINLPQKAQPTSDEIAQHKSKLKQSEAGVTDLRKEIEQLKIENTALKKQLLNFILERRLPPNAQALQDRISDLEHQLEKNLKKSV